MHSVPTFLIIILMLGSMAWGSSDFDRELYCGISNEKKDAFRLVCQDKKFKKDFDSCCDFSGVSKPCIQMELAFGDSDQAGNSRASSCAITLRVIVMKSDKKDPKNSQLASGTFKTCDDEQTERVQLPNALIAAGAICEATVNASDYKKDPFDGKVIACGRVAKSCLAG